MHNMQKSPTPLKKEVWGTEGGEPLMEMLLNAEKYMLALQHTKLYTETFGKM